jgi:hypothetical protein
MTLMDEPQKDNPETTVSVPSPGVVVAPMNTPVTPPAQAAVQAPLAEPQAPQAPEAPQSVTTPPADAAVAPETPSLEPKSSPEEEDPQSITWMTPEFHDHEKSISWYFILAIATVGLAAILFLWTKSIVTGVAVVISGIILGIYGTNRPGQLEYLMNPGGIRIGSKQYQYDDFKLFIVTTGSFPEITLVPVKRFMPSLSVRYSPDVENKVLNMLADHLPFEERRPDLIDTLMHRMRF